MGQEEKKELPETLQPAACMPLLNETEYAFFLRLLAGDEPTAAFKAVVPCAHWADRKIFRAAMEMRNSEPIEAALDAALGSGAGGETLTRAAHLRNLERIRTRCERDGNWATALHAEIARGKVAGLHTEHQELTITFDPLPMLRRMAEIDESAARATAARIGVPFDNVLGRAAPLLPAPSPPPPSEALDDA